MAYPAQVAALGPRKNLKHVAWQLERGQAQRLARMVRAAKASTLSVPQILLEAQRSSAVHIKCARLFWTLQQADPTRCFDELKQCLTSVLLVAQARFATTASLPPASTPLPRASNIHPCQHFASRAWGCI